MVDPTSSLGEDVDEESAPRCAVCEESLAGVVEHRVVTWVADSAVRARHFCSEACLNEWDDERR